MRRVFLMLTALTFVAFVALGLTAFGQHSTVLASAKHPDATRSIIKHVVAHTPAPTVNTSKLPPGYVGSKVCETCHTSIAKSFATNPHNQMVSLHGDMGLTCENCHGSGLAHVESGGNPKKIFNFETAAPKQVDEKCLTCHATAHPDFMRSPHAKAGVDCLSCHSVHHAKSAHLLLASQPKLCYQCHTDVKAQFAEPFHHPVPEGMVKCSDCHDVHGTFSIDNLRTTADENQVCTKCHTAMRGPFVYEHPAIKAVGCLGCHDPHGSVNPDLLKVANVNMLCNRCHSPVAMATVHGMGEGSQEITPCTDCHTEIHGSNINPAFIR